MIWYLASREKSRALPVLHVNFGGNELSNIISAVTEKLPRPPVKPRSQAPVEQLETWKYLEI